MIDMKLNQLKPLVKSITFQHFNPQFNFTFITKILEESKNNKLEFPIKKKFPFLIINNFMQIDFNLNLKKAGSSK